LDHFHNYRHSACDYESGLNYIFLVSKHLKFCVCICKETSFDNVILLTLCFYSYQKPIAILNLKILQREIVMHLILTFGFSISIKSNSNHENDKNTNKDKVKKREVRQRSKEKEISKNEFEITQSLKNVIHIYVENNDFCLRPIVCPIKKDTYWVVFSVHHLVHLNEVQLKKFFNYVIICKIFYGKQKFSERAKKDKVKKFYIDNKSTNVKREEFLELYHSNSTKRSSPSLLQTIITDEIYGDFSMTTYFDVIPDSTHEYLFRKMLRKGCFPIETLMFGLFDINSIKNEVKSSSKRVKKSQIKKNKKEKQRLEIYEIRLPAEVLFS
ncbi:unnamed protein product, partial [Heterotrigona itama]